MSLRSLLFFPCLLVVTSVFIGCDGGKVSTPVGQRSGQEIYQTYCFPCHDSGAVGAPKIGDAQAMQRLRDKRFDTLLENTRKGLKAMPRLGTCLDCTEEELKRSVEYLLEDKQK